MQRNYSQRNKVNSSRWTITLLTHSQYATEKHKLKAVSWIVQPKQPITLYLNVFLGILNTFNQPGLQITPVLFRSHHRH